MEYSMESVSKRMILVIAVLSVLIAVGGGVFYFINDNIFGTLPFALGVFMAMCTNVAKVLLLKRTVERAVDMEEKSAKLHLQGQYLIRLLITAGVFGLAHVIPFVNIMGALIGIFTLQIATHSLRLFIKEEPMDMSKIIPYEDDEELGAVEEEKTE